jgi:hypothetical protein
MFIAHIPTRRQGRRVDDRDGRLGSEHARTTRSAGAGDGCRRWDGEGDGDISDGTATKTETNQ